MMTIIIGVSNLLIGTAYICLGLLSAWEAISQYRYRGLSRFGLAFSLMASSCGPHHVIHGWCVLQGGTVSPPMLAVALLGLPAGVVFCWLRVEVMLGGRGDRIVAVTSRAMIVLAVALLGAFGILAGWAMATPTLPNQAICTALGAQFRTATAGSMAPSLIVFSNLFVTFTYSIVGWYLFETQVLRYVASRSWSLSGLSLAAVFPTCAAMHLILALTNSLDSATLPFDLLGVPASIYFLLVVNRLHMDSVVDWNRRPLVGVAATPNRSAPWCDVINDQQLPLR